MKLTELIIAEARAREIRHFFGLPGGGSPLDLVDAGRRRGVDFVTVAHESSATIMAAYYGFMKETVGLALGIKGVGAGNLAGGAVNAYFERGPVVCLCETLSTGVPEREMVQHCDHGGMFGAVTKYQTYLTPDQAPSSLQEAVFQATDGRPGPVLLNLPAEWAQQESGDPLSVRTSPQPARTDERQLAQARECIGNARRPLVIAGADVVRAGATHELQALVEGIEAAVLVNMDARGVFPESHPRWSGVLMGAFTPNIIETETMAQADLVLLVGADPMMTHSPWVSDLPTCELVARPEYDTLVPQPSARVDGDLKQTLGNLLSLRQPGLPEEEIQATRKKILRNFERPAQARLAAQDIIEITRSAMPEEGLLISESGAFICTLEHLWPVERPGTFWGTSGGRTMGLTVPAILGAKLARPESPMIGIGGDGSLLMRLGELEAFARTGVAVPLIIINDQALGTIKSRQRSRGLSEYSLDLHPVDFAAVAQAMGLRGATVTTPEQFEKELRAALEADRTTLIDCRVDPVAYQDSFGPTIGVLP